MSRPSQVSSEPHLHIVSASERGPEPEARTPQRGCPSWCTQEHLGEGTDAGGFHHDGTATTVSAARDVTAGSPVDVHVTLSQHVRPDGTDEAAHVEVMDNYRTVALLSAEEALRLAEALVLAARSLRLTTQPADVPVQSPSAQQPAGGTSIARRRGHRV